MAKKLLSKYSGQKAALADAALYTNFFKFKQFQLYPAPIVQLQYSEFFKIKSSFEGESTISTDPRPKKISFLFIYRRYKTQLCIVMVHLKNLFRSKCTKVKFGGND